MNIAWKTFPRVSTLNTIANLSWFLLHPTNILDPDQNNKQTEKNQEASLIDASNARNRPYEYPRPGYRNNKQPNRTGAKEAPEAVLFKVRALSKVWASVHGIKASDRDTARGTPQPCRNSK